MGKKNIRTQAFVNFYAALGTLSKFCEYDEQARTIAAQQDISVRFKVKGGPDGLLSFKGGKVTCKHFEKGDKADVKLYCGSCKKFNDVVDGKSMPLPMITARLYMMFKFMIKPTDPFNVLTKELTSVMRFGKKIDGTQVPDLAIRLQFHAMCAAIAQIANVDRIGMVTAKRFHDGDISMKIGDSIDAQGNSVRGEAATLRCLNKKVKYSGMSSGVERAFMEFDSLDSAGKLISGELDAMSALSSGKLVMKGFIPFLDDVNKILNIVPLYLA